MNLNFHTSDAGEHTAHRDGRRYTIRPTDNAEFELVIDREKFLPAGSWSYLDSAILDTFEDAAAVAESYADLEVIGHRGFRTQLDTALDAAA